MTIVLTMTVPEPMRGARQIDFKLVIAVTFPRGAVSGDAATLDSHFWLRFAKIPSLVTECFPIFAASCLRYSLRPGGLFSSAIQISDCEFAPRERSSLITSHRDKQC